MVTGGFIHPYQHYIDITSICGVADDTWKTVNVSGYISPEAKNVLLYIRNPNSQYWFGIRPKGSDWSDGADGGHVGSRIYNNHQKFIIMKLDENLEFEITRSNAGTTVEIAGWDDGALTFLSDRVDITPVANNTWEEKDLSSYIPAEATGIYVKMVSSANSNLDCGAKEKGSSNNHRWMWYRATKWWSCGVDVDKKVELRKESASITIYLIGYYVSPVHFLTNKVMREPAPNGTWTNVSISGVFPTDNIDFAFFSTDGSTYIGILPSGGSGGDKGIHYGGCGAFAHIVSACTYSGYTQDNGVHIYLEGYQEMDTARYMLDLNVEDENQYSLGVVTTMTGVSGIRWIRKTFIHNDLFWIFYVDTDSKCYYKSSSDGVNWSSATFLHDTSYQYGVACSIWFDGSKVHVFVKKTPKQYYRSGTPNTDGTITWDTTWQVSMEFTPNPSTVGDHSGCVDKDGYPWLVWTIENTGGGVGALEVWANVSQNNDGTWNDLAGYPKDITNGTAADNYREGYLLPFPANRDLYVILIKGNQPLLGRYYTQSTDTWNTVETVSTSNVIETYAVGGEMWSCSAVIDQWGHVHIVFTDDNNRIIYLKRDFNTGAWSDEVVLATGVPDHSTPTMTIDYSNDDLYIFYVKDDIIYLIRGVNWSVGGLATEWVDATPYGGIAIGVGAGVDGQISTQRRVIDNLIITIGVTGSSSPYSYRAKIFKVGKASIMVDGENRQTPWKMSLLETASFDVTIAEEFNGYYWKYWKDNLSTDRTRTISMNPSDKGFIGYYITKKGWFSEVKEDLKTHIESCIVEASVSGNWRENIREFSRNMPFISVRIGPEIWDDVYERRIVEPPAGNFGALADYSFSLHIFHSNCSMAGEEKGKYAQDVASRIITCLTQTPAPVGADIYDIRARESEPARGGHRVSRVIITGRITIKRID